MILGHCPSYMGDEIFPFDKIFTKSLGLYKPEHVKGCDAILLWGGEDIWPGYYEQEAHPRSQNHGQASKRDQHEWACMMAAQEYDVPIIGICRGAQFLCAFAGGELVQHMTHHHQNHDVMVYPVGAADDDAKCVIYETSSDHHQMMYLDNMPKDDYEVLGWAAGLSTTYENDKGKMPMPARGFMLEPEAVYFPKVRGFAIQGHPEWMNYNDEYVKWCNGQIAHLLLKALA